LTDNNYCVFDFHHTDPQEKEYMWTKLRLFSDSRIQEELAKCILLCANCHRMAHHDQ
jgi:predicted HNH restriction endonuclease